VGHRVTAQAIDVIGGDGFHEFRIVFCLFHGTLTNRRREVPSNATAPCSAFPLALKERPPLILED
jgi:hypothetical protein